MRLPQWMRVDEALGSGMNASTVVHAFVATVVVGKMDYVVVAALGEDVGVAVHVVEDVSVLVDAGPVGEESVRSVLWCW